jgi:hypothetical protein
MPLTASDQEFITAWQRLKKATLVAKALGITVRNTYSRRRVLETRYGLALEAINPIVGAGAKSEAGRLANELAAKRAEQYEGEMHDTIADGVVLVASDCHYWPGIVTEAHQAFVRLAKSLKPVMVVLNGDILDGARISRHPRIMWEQQPQLKDEIHAVQDRCGEIERAAGKAKLIRTIGNHDARFENYLSGRVAEVEGMPGSTLLDYLPKWRAGWALHLNARTDGWVCIRHRPVNGGVHAAYNSTLKAGVSYVHGHLHQLKVTPWADYRGRRYGVDTGTMADVGGPQFTYVEAGPLNWASGFAVLTFREGRLLPPELVVVDDGKAWFRGEAA